MRFFRASQSRIWLLRVHRVLRLLCLRWSLFYFFISFSTRLAILLYTFLCEARFFFRGPQNEKHITTRHIGPERLESIFLDCGDIIITIASLLRTWIWVNKTHKRPGNETARRVVVSLPSSTLGRTLRAKSRLLMARKRARRHYCGRDSRFRRRLEGTCRFLKSLRRNAPHTFDGNINERAASGVALKAKLAFRLLFL